MSDKKPQGPNVRRLITYKMSGLAVPAGGGLTDALALFTEPGRLGRVAREATAWVEEAIAVVKTAPDNPFGDDDEAIAGELLARLEAKKRVER